MNSHIILTEKILLFSFQKAKALKNSQLPYAYRTYSTRLVFIVGKKARYSPLQ